MDLQSSPSIATLRTALDVPEGTLIGNHHRVLIQRTRGLIHTAKFVSKPCVFLANGALENNGDIWTPKSSKFDETSKV